MFQTTNQNGLVFTGKLKPESPLDFMGESRDVSCRSRTLVKGVPPSHHPLEDWLVLWVIYGGFLMAGVPQNPYEIVDDWGVLGGLRGSKWLIQ